MNNSEIFKSSHKIARETVSVVGNYQIAFTLALNSVYASQRRSTEQMLLALGCVIWEQYGKKRIYINAEQMGDVFGLKINFYKTGNISNAFLHGDKISNTKTYKIMANKHFFDCDTKKFVSTLSAII